MSAHSGPAPGSWSSPLRGATHRLVRMVTDLQVIRVCGVLRGAKP
jgi:hypothetical protein